MSDSFPYQFQANFKFGPQYKEALVNVPANSPEELLQKLEWLTANAAKFVAAQAALQSVPPGLAGNVTNTQVETYETGQPMQQQAPPQQQNSGWGAPQQQGPPSFANPAQEAPVCQHGPRVFKSGTGAKGAWQAWMCPTPKGTPGQCQPQWVK